MKVYQYAQEEDDGSFGELYEALAGVPGIVYHGSVGQRELAKGLEKCKVLSYPNTFRETSCIAQLEAQAAGNVVVTSGIGALPETVGPHGFLIPGFPGQDNYNEVFADKCIALLKYEVGWKKLAVEARQWAWENHSYEVISKQTELTLEKLIANKGSIKCLL
jgi:glycosyltransferase involved in cell wall biosynthesis